LGPDPLLLETLQGLDLELYIGGGLQESDVIRLGESGFAGGLVDPYTPVIRDLVANAPKAPTTTEASAPTPAPRATPAPGSVPSSGGAHVRPQDEGKLAIREHVRRIYRATAGRFMQDAAKVDP